MLFVFGKKAEILRKSCLFFKAMKNIWPHSEKNIRYFKNLVKKQKKSM